MTKIALESGCFVLSAHEFCRRKDYLLSLECISGGSNDDISLDNIICSGGSVIISSSSQDHYGWTWLPWRVHLSMTVNNLELAKSEKYRHLLMEDGLTHFVSQIWNNLVHCFMFQIFERIVRAKPDFSRIWGQVGLNSIEQAPDIPNPILFTTVVKA